jgi:hypothetical protein
LTFRKDEFSVLCGAGSELSVGLERDAGADWKSAMSEALFGFKIANQLAATAFRELSVGQRHVGWGEIGGDVCGGGFFAYGEDLGV